MDCLRNPFITKYFIYNNCNLIYMAVRNDPYFYTAGARKKYLRLM